MEVVAVLPSRRQRLRSQRMRFPEKQVSQHWRSRPLWRVLEIMLFQIVQDWRRWQFRAVYLRWEQAYFQGVHGCPLSACRRLWIRSRTACSAAVLHLPAWRSLRRSTVSAAMPLRTARALHLWQYRPEWQRSAAELFRDAPDFPVFLSRQVRAA